MRFTKYLEDLLGTKSDIKILRTLCEYPTKEFNESELARVSRVGQKTVNRMMPKYVGYGIVNVRTIGRANVYSLNSEHYIVKQLMQLFKAESVARLELERRLREAFKDDEDIISLVVFGSLARGEEKPTSDIDVFVVAEDKEGVKNRLQAVEEITMKEFGNVISEYILTPEEFRRKRKAQAIKEILAHGVLIVGKPLGEKDAGY
ncbi:MAG: nucleotidyltransferase domain-containing protein [Candidatus Hadarchaeales archaeon]